MALAQMEKVGRHRDPADDAQLAPLIARARKTLGDSAFTVAEAAGRMLSYEETLTDARCWLESIPKQTQR